MLSSRSPTRPRISVVMTVFNQATYLGEAIESILRQDERDFELIVVDDGSTDESAEVARRYGDRLTLLDRPNGGLGAARNTGIEHARGEFIAFCDADDIHLPHRLSAQRRVLERVPRAALVFSELTPFRDGQVLPETVLRERVLGPTRRPFDEEIRAAFSASTTCEEWQVPVGELHRSAPIYWGRAPGLIALTHVAWGGASMFRRAALRAVGGHDERLRRYADWDLASRLAKAYELAFLDVPVVLYRLHDSQLTKKVGVGLRCYRDIIDQVWRRDPVAYAQHQEVIDRSLGSALWQLGNLAGRSGAWTDAVSCFFSSIRAYPRQKAAYFDLVRACVRSAA